MLHCLFSELNLFLTQNNNPTLFSLPALAFYYFQVLRPVSLASRCAWGVLRGGLPFVWSCAFHIEYYTGKAQEEMWLRKKKSLDFFFFFLLKRNCETCDRVNLNRRVQIKYVHGAKN